MVPPAEDILRTLKYNYKATTGKASYSQSTGIIVGPFHPLLYELITPSKSNTIVLSLDSTTIDSLINSTKLFMHLNF